MSTKSFLQKLTEKSKLESCYQEEIVEFSKIILENWKINCVNAAARKKYRGPLYAFSMDVQYKEIPISHMIERGLLKILEKEIELEVFFAEYIIKTNGNVILELKSDEITSENDIILDFPDFAQNKKVFTRIGVIYAKWDPDIE